MDIPLSQRPLSRRIAKWLRPAVCASCVLALLLVLAPGSISRADELPKDVEKQIDEQTEKLPKEIRDKMRKKLKEAVAERIAEMKEKAEEDEEEEESEEEGDEDADEEEGEESEEDEDEDEDDEDEEEEDDEKTQLEDEMELEEARFNFRVHEYKMQLAEQRLAAEKSKIDRELEEERMTQQMAAMKSELSRLQSEMELIQARAELDQAKLEAELAAVAAEKQRLESQVEMEDLKEKLEDRILGEEQYPAEPFKDGVLHVSLRRIELNGPIFDGAAEYVCQRLDYYNNQSAAPIFLVIDDCPGGSAIEGMQIVQAIERSKAPVHVVVKRFAASMAAIITTLADHSYCYPDAIILHHQASSALVGNGRDMEDQKRQFNEISKRLIGAVAKKIGTTEKEFVDEMYKNRVSGDWELFGDQAVKAKWVDNIAHTIREQGVRTKPTGQRAQPFFFPFFSDAQKSAAASSQAAPNGYLERYQVTLPEQTDERGRRFVRLPRLRPVDVWLLYNPDSYYRQ